MVSAPRVCCDSGGGAAPGLKLAWVCMATVCSTCFACCWKRCLICICTQVTPARVAVASALSTQHARRRRQTPKNRKIRQLPSQLGCASLCTTYAIEVLERPAPLRLLCMNAGCGAAVRCLRLTFLCLHRAWAISSSHQWTGTTSRTAALSTLLVLSVR